MKFNKLEISLPRWLENYFQGCTDVYPSVEDRMRLVIELSRMNIEASTGGPFAAAIFEAESGKLIAPGVNLVASTNCSVLHAEIVAIMIVQKMLGTYDLGSCGEYELVTSCQPCAMCMGAIPWSGVKKVVCGARDEDARAIGFDEGCKPDHWQKRWQKRGIETIEDILRADCKQVLIDYGQNKGTIYNAS